MKIRLPIRGVVDILPDSKQPDATTRDMLSMRGEDPVTRKIRLAQRSGLTKYISTQVAGAFPIRAMRSLSYQRKNVLYTDKTTMPLGLADVPYSALTGSASTVSVCHTDRQGNVYASDGLAGIAKYNSALERQWKLALPVDQETATVRALRIATLGFPDADSEAVFAGVSSGGLQKDAKVWVYKQISTRDEEGKVETKTELVSDFKPGAYTEVIKVRNGLMYCAQNEPDKGRSYVRAYFGLTTPTPILALQFEVPYPVYGMDVRASDGKICTAHPPNSKRGKDPSAPGFTGPDLAREWTPDLLVDKDSRLWAHFIAADLDLEDGDPVRVWPDRSPKARNLVQGATSLAEYPVFRKRGAGGEPCVVFNGGDAGVSPNLESATNPSAAAQFDDQQRTILPQYMGEKWAMFIVLRPAIEAVVRPLFTQGNQHPLGADADTNTIAINKTAITAATLNADPFAGRGVWWTTTDAANGEGAGLATTGGARNVPFPFDWLYAGSTGTVILTIVNDGHSNSGTDAAQHSILRINGRPVDRYLNAAEASLLQSFLGTGPAGLVAFFRGEVSEILVLRDYAAGGAHGDPLTGALDGAGTSHYPRAIGTFGSAAKAWAANTTNRYNDNEIERIEGYLAGRYRVSHIFPHGTASVLSATANYAAGETVVTGGKTYTFVAALTGAAGEVLIEANTKLSTVNLMYAINGSGAAGVKYDANLKENTFVRATCINDQDTATAKLKVETIGLLTSACTETCANASWSNNPTAAQATVTTSAILYMPGHYPHPFAIPYGFPRPDVGATIGVTLESKGLLLNSAEGILACWDPNGKIAWVATSRLSVAQPGGFSLPAADMKFGAIGYDCMFGPEIKGDTTKVIYSTGPQYSASAGDQGSVLRRIVDNGTSCALTGTGTWTMGTTALVGAITEFSLSEPHVRIDVDTFGNVYLPFYEPTPANSSIMSLVCVATVDVAGVPTPQVAFTWRVGNVATNPGGVCVAVDQKLTAYDGDPAKRAFAVYLGTRMGYTTDLLTQPNLYRIESVSAKHTVGVPATETKLCAVANGEFWTSLNGADWLQPVGVGSLANPVLARDSVSPDSYVSMAALNGHLFITDGLTYLDYDGRRDTLSPMRSKTAGELKPNARRVSAVHGCLVWYRFADDPTEFLMSAVGNPYDYDIAPPVTTATQAVLGTKAPRGTGQARDIINNVFQYDADTSIWGCQSSVWRLDGHPMDNGRFVRLSDSTGLAFGDSICTDENGVVYGFGTRGGVFKITGSGLTSISDGAIPVRLRSIDFSTTRVAMLWDNQEQGFHLFLIPVNPAVAATYEHYFWSRNLQGWYPDQFADAGMQPTCTFVGDGDLASNRRAVIGCVDGYARAFDSAATDDDGVAIQSRALIGPFTADEGPTETHFKDMRVILATGQGGCGFRLFGTDTPDMLGTAVESGSLAPGRNETLPVQAVGCYVAIEVSNSTRERFSVESIDMDAYVVGPV